MTEFFLEIVNRSITASYLIGVVVVLRLVLSRAPKWIRVFLWGLVAIRLVVPFSFESAFSLMPETVPFSAVAAQGTAEGIAAGAKVLEEDTDYDAEITKLDGVKMDVAAAGKKEYIVEILAVVWLAGVMVLLGYCVVSYARLQVRMSDAVICSRDKQVVYLSEKVSSPFVLGLVKPRIYIPYGLDETDKACVIAHERAHILRKDHWIKLLSYVILAFYWFQPSVWLAYVLLSRDIELACDEQVMRELGISAKKVYSNALLHCSVERNRIGVCPLAFGEVGVKKRIVNILHYKKPAVWVVVVSLVLCVAAAMCFLTDPKEEPVSQDSYTSEEKVPKEIEGKQTDKRQTDGMPQEMTGQSLEENGNTSGEKTPLVKPPVMILQDSLSGTLNAYSVESGTYSWSHSTDNADEVIHLEASGPFPTIAVKGREEEWLQLVDYNGLEYFPYLVDFEVIPDSIRVREYDLLEIGDMEPLVLSETVLEEEDVLELKPRRIYEVTAMWSEDKLSANGFSGEAIYIFATDNEAVEAEGLGVQSEVAVDADISERIVLEEFIMTFYQAYFTGDLSTIKESLVSDFQWDVDAYPYPEEADEVEFIQIKGLQQIEDLERTGRFTVWVECLLPNDDSLTYLTIECTKENGDWKIEGYGLEK